MMLVIFCCLLFLIMIVYPFWPGYKEMKRGQDNDNLYIKKDYVKDPRYFGLSFRNLLEPFFGQIRELSAGQTLEIDLSKKELIILGQAQISRKLLLKIGSQFFLKISFYRLNRHLQKKFMHLKN